MTSYKNAVKATFKKCVIGKHDYISIEPSASFTKLTMVNIDGFLDNTVLHATKNGMLEFIFGTIELDAERKETAIVVGKKIRLITGSKDPSVELAILMAKQVVECHEILSIVPYMDDNSTILNLKDMVEQYTTTTVDESGVPVFSLAEAIIYSIDFSDRNGMEYNLSVNLPENPTHKQIDLFMKDIDVCFENKSKLHGYVGVIRFNNTTSLNDTYISIYMDRLFNGVVPPASIKPEVDSMLEKVKLAKDLFNKHQ